MGKHVSFRFVGQLPLSVEQIHELLKDHVDHGSSRIHPSIVEERIEQVDEGTSLAHRRVRYVQTGRRDSPCRLAIAP